MIIVEVQNGAGHLFNGAPRDVENRPFLPRKQAPRVSRFGFDKIWINIFRLSVFVQTHQAVFAHLHQTLCAGG